MKIYHVNIFTALQYKPSCVQLIYFYLSYYLIMVFISVARSYKFEPGKDVSLQP